MFSSSAAHESAHERTALREAVFWILFNPLLAALIGAAFNGAEGAAIGFFLGVILIASPKFFGEIPNWTRRAFLRFAPIRSKIWRLMPKLLRERIEERRFK